MDPQKVPHFCLSGCSLLPPFSPMSMVLEIFLLRKTCAIFPSLHDFYFLFGKPATMLKLAQRLPSFAVGCLLQEGASMIEFSRPSLLMFDSEVIPHQLAKPSLLSCGCNSLAQYILEVFVPSMNYKHSTKKLGPSFLYSHY